MTTLLSIAEQMREAKLAPVMANMTVVKANELTVKLLDGRNLPEPGGGNEQNAAN